MKGANAHLKQGGLPFLSGEKIASFDTSDAGERV